MYFLEPFQFDFMQRAFLAAICVGVSCSSVGVYVVLRQMTFMGDALAHASLPGIVGAHMLGVHYFFGAMASNIITALGIGYLSEKEKFKEDTAIGVLFSGMFALGILMLYKTHTYRDLTHILFGYILGVSMTDVWVMLGISIIVVMALVIWHKKMELCFFDPDYAVQIGYNPRKIRYLLLILVAVAVVSAIQGVGVVLTSAMLVIPPAVASMFARSLKMMIVFSMIFGVFSSVSGLYLSYWLSWPSGITIVLFATGAFFLILFIREVLNYGLKKKNC